MTYLSPRNAIRTSSRVESVRFRRLARLPVHENAEISVSLHVASEEEEAQSNRVEALCQMKAGVLLQRACWSCLSSSAGAVLRYLLNVSNNSINLDRIEGRQVL